MSSLGTEGSLCTDPSPNHWTIETYNLLKKVDSLPDGAVRRIATLTSMDGSHGIEGVITIHPSLESTGQS